VLGWVGTPQRMLRSESCLLCVIAVQNAFRSASHTLPLKSCARCRLEQLGDKPRLLSLLVVCHVMATKLNNFPYALFLCSKPVADLSIPPVMPRYSSVAAPSGLPPRLMTNVFSPAPGHCLTAVFTFTDVSVGHVYFLCQDGERLLAREPCWLAVACGASRAWTVNSRGISGQEPSRVCFNRACRFTRLLCCDRNMYLGNSPYLTFFCI